MRDFLTNWFYRIAAKGYLPRELFERRVPRAEDLPARTGSLSIEIVSHCWNYAHWLRFQLSSLVLHPPRQTRVVMTVIHSPEDKGTVELLAEYGRMMIPNVVWNWVPVDKSKLFRRAIGRNLRAKATTADWIFFTDCDQMFYEGSLDALGESLQGRRDFLVFPRVAQCSQRISDPSEVTVDRGSGADAKVVAIDTSLFHPVVHQKAVGGLQIVHGDVARAVGYCESLRFYQTPQNGFTNTYEDRAFRWLLGTHGIPVDIPHVYRIEHHHKGRYESRRLPSWLRPLFSNAGRADMLAKLRRKEAASLEAATFTQEASPAGSRRAA